MKEFAGDKQGAGKKETGDVSGRAKDDSRGGQVLGFGGYGAGEGQVAPPDPMAAMRFGHMGAIRMAQSGGVDVTKHVGKSAKGGGGGGASGEKEGLGSLGEVNSGISQKLKKSTGVDVSDAKVVSDPKLEDMGKRGVARDGKEIGVAMPELVGDDELMAHEGIHIVQQRGGSEKGGPSKSNNKKVNSAQSVEEEALRGADLLRDDKRAAVQSATSSSTLWEEDVAPQDDLSESTIDGITVSAEQFLLANEEIAEYVQHAVKKSGGLTGRVEVLSVDEFRAQFVEEGSKNTNPKTQLSYTSEELQELYNEGNPKGFRRGERAMVRQDVSEILQVVVHEGLHLLADPSFKKQLGHGVDEGTTEYFARRSLEGTGTIIDEEQYYDVYLLIDALVGHVGEAALARAYFEGDLAPMKEELENSIQASVFDAFRSAVLKDNLEGYKEAWKIVE